MSYLFNIAYVLLVVVLSPWLLWAAIAKGKYRQGWAEKLLGRVPIREGKAPCVWLHAVSVGEVNLLAGLLRGIAERHPDWQCVISTTTASGYELAKKKYAQHTVFYAPLDFSWAVHAALDRIRPDMLILAELELWPNLIRLARRRGVHTAVVNGRLSAKSHRGYRWIRPIVGLVLRKVDLIAVQNDLYAHRFLSLGAPVESLRGTGSLKFDGASTDRDHPETRRLAALAGIGPDDVVFLAGSTQHPEESLALAAWQRLAKKHPRLRLVIVPRHPHRFDAVARLLQQADVNWQRRTELDATGPDPAARVLLVDAVGELGAWWGTAHIGFVGGSMGTRGGQNMIEPAAYGTAVCFGPNTHNFRDVVTAMLAADAAVVVKDGDELTAFVTRCLEENGFAQGLGQRAQRLVQSQLGATERTLDLLDELWQQETDDRADKAKPHMLQGPHTTQPAARDAREAGRMIQGQND